MCPSPSATVLEPFPLDAPASQLPSHHENRFSHRVAETNIYQSWAKKLSGMTDRAELTEQSAKHYRAQGLKFFCYLLTTQHEPHALETALTSADSSERLNTLLARSLRKLDLPTIMTHLRAQETPESRQGVHQARSLLVTHLLPWAHTQNLTNFDVRDYNRQSFRLEKSLDDHMVRRNELLLKWGAELDTYFSEATAANYKNVVRRYLRYLRENYLSAEDRRAIESGSLHPARALNDLILKEPFERLDAFLKQYSGWQGDSARSIILNDFYEYLHRKGLTKFDPHSYPRGTFFPELPASEAIVRESPLLAAWAESVREDPNVGADAAAGYIRCVARYMFFVRDEEMMVSTGRGKRGLDPSIREPEKALDRFVVRLEPEFRLAKFLKSVESERSYEVLRWLLAERFYPWLAEQDSGTTFNHDRFATLLAA